MPARLISRAFGSIGDPIPHWHITIHQDSGNVRAWRIHPPVNLFWIATMNLPAINPLTAGAVVFATAATDAVYVRFTSAVVARRPLSAANWSGLWYLLSSFAVISYTNNWAYVCFAAIGSWVGAFLSLTFWYHQPPRGPTGSAVE